MFRNLLSSSVLLVLVFNSAISLPSPNYVELSSEEDSREVSGQESLSELEYLHDNIFKLKTKNPPKDTVEEVVEEIAPGQFIAKYRLKHSYSGPVARIITTYETGPNAYLTKYSIVPKESQVRINEE